jgi:hypothetical protein
MRVTAAIPILTAAGTRRDAVRSVFSRSLENWGLLLARTTSRSLPKSVRTANTCSPTTVWKWSRSVSSFTPTFAGLV